MEASFPKDIIMIKLKLKLLINKCVYAGDGCGIRGISDREKQQSPGKKNKQPKNNEETQNKRKKKNPLRLGWRVR